MTRLIMIIAAVINVSMVCADSFSYRFNATPLPKAIQQIMEDHPEMDVNFIYNELENYKTNATVNADNAFDALRQTIGLNPVTLTRSKGSYYVEALQHGRFAYTGRTVGPDDEPIVAATVMLLAPKDSTVLTYGFTDSSGHFSIPCDSKAVIAKLSCLGYKTTYKDFDVFNVGTIRMNEVPINLKNVNVEGENTSLYTDRSIYRPTQRQRNASQNAIDLLRHLAIPQINIDLVDESVTTLTGAGVAIYVNGLPASAEELHGIRTSDVKSVEYLDFPIDPRFSGNEHVINFIMTTYEYGGYTKLSASENTLVGLSSRATLYSKFSYKDMVYDLYAGASNLDIHHSGVSLIGNYTLKDDDGSPDILTRHEESTGSHLKNSQYPVSFRAIYEKDRIQIANTVGLNLDLSPVEERSGKLTFSSDKLADYSFQNNQTSKTRHFTWSGSYYFILPAEFHLNLTPRANYGHTDYSYLYAASLPGNDPIENNSGENYYRISGGAYLYKEFSQTHGASANLYAGTNRNEVNYTGASPYKNDFSDSFAGMRIGYNFNNRRWRFSSNVALQWEHNGINGNYVSELYPLINVSGDYSPSTHHSFQTFFHFGANYPGESVKSPNILQTNEIMYKTGNPDLPLSRQITFNLQYNWVAGNRLSLSLYGQYFGEYKLYVPVFESYKNGAALLQTYESAQDYNRTQIGMSFNLKLLDGSLQLAAKPSVTIFRYNGCYNMSENPFLLNASVSYYFNRFYFQASYQSANKTIQGNRGVWYKTRDFYQLQAGWSNSNWNIRMSAFNMFRSDWIASTQILNAPLYSEMVHQEGTYYHRRINLSVTYTLGYGRKLQHGNEVGEQSGASSAILK